MSNQPSNHSCESTTGQKCPNCQTSFVCGLTAGHERCWCMDLPAVMPVCADAKCLCPECLKRAIDNLLAAPATHETH